MDRTRKCQVLVIGSGAGGATTALTLAENGFQVTLLEEGARHPLSHYGQSPIEGMRRLYRRRGMTPIMGKAPIGFIEGCCYGGSTEVNSGFWHRTPREILLRWKAQYDLAEASEEELAPYFDWAEKKLGVGPWQKEWPSATKVFGRCIEAMGWSYQEAQRAAPGCKNSNSCPTGCPTGAKQGMSFSLLRQCESLGVEVLTSCRARTLIRKRGRILGVIAIRKDENGEETAFRVDADHVFVCCGPTETPSLLFRSGIRFHVGNTLRIHPYIKVSGFFPEQIDSEKQVLPLLQVKEFWPEISFGGSFFSKGQLAMSLSDNWPETESLMRQHRNAMVLYVGVKGTGKGSVRPTVFGRDGTIIRYELSPEDRINLGKGLARLSCMLLAGGARDVIPSVYGIKNIKTESEALRWLDEPIPSRDLSLTTVHAFSSCPIGERDDRCAANSYGQVFHYANLYINDASMLPDSPGVNPQGSIMAMARRNALKFVDSQKK